MQQDHDDVKRGLSRRALVQGATGAAAAAALGQNGRVVLAQEGSPAASQDIAWPPGQGSDVRGPRAERLTFGAFLLGNVDCRSDAR